MNDTSSRLLAAIARVAMVMKTDAWRTTLPAGLTPTQSQALILLRTRGPRRPAAIAEGLAVRRPTASDVLAALETKGLIVRTADPTDARASIVHLTPLGEQRADLLAVWPDHLLAAADLLTTAEQGVLLSALSRMIRRLQEQGRIPVSRMCVTCRWFRPDVHPSPTAPHHCAFVDAPFGDRDLRMECSDHQPEGETT